MNNNPFPQKLLKQQLESLPKVNYFIATDTYDENASAYILYKYIDGHLEIVNSRTVISQEDFDEEVKNVAKYFNAEINPKLEELSEGKSNRKYGYKLSDNTIKKLFKYYNTQKP